MAASRESMNRGLSGISGSSAPASNPSILLEFALRKQDEAERLRKEAAEAEAEAERLRKEAAQLEVPQPATDELDTLLEQFRLFQPIAQPAVNPTELATFLKQVADGQQNEAEASLKRNPALALASGNVPDHTGRTIIDIFGFQYALWALDWRMWKMILKYLPLESAKAQAQQALRDEHYKIEGLLKSMENYIRSYLIQIIRLPDYGNNSEFEWGNVATMQHKLPMHFLQEYCYPNRAFYPIPSFTEDTLPRKLGFDLSKFHYEQCPLMDYHEFFGGCHINRGICRGINKRSVTIGACELNVGSLYKEIKARCAREGRDINREDMRYIEREALRSCAACIDLKALTVLYNIRLEQRRELLAQLSIPSQPKPGQAMLFLAASSSSVSSSSSASSSITAASSLPRVHIS